MIACSVEAGNDLTKQINVHENPDGGNRHRAHHRVFCIQLFSMVIVRLINDRLIELLAFHFRPINYLFIHSCLLSGLFIYYCSIFQ